MHVIVRVAVLQSSFASPRPSSTRARWTAVAAYSSTAGVPLRHPSLSFQSLGRGTPCRSALPHSSSTFKLYKKTSGPIKAATKALQIGVEDGLAAKERYRPQEEAQRGLQEGRSNEIQFFYS